jgi:hypothetical protein
MGLFSKKPREEESDEKREKYYQKIVDRVPNDHKDDWDESDEHPNEFFCGRCGWVHISRFPHCH